QRCAAKNRDKGADDAFNDTLHLVQDDVAELCRMSSHEIFIGLSHHPLQYLGLDPMSKLVEKSVGYPLVKGNEEVASRQDCNSEEAEQDQEIVIGLRAGSLVDTLQQVVRVQPLRIREQQDERHY